MSLKYFCSFEEHSVLDTKGLVRKITTSPQPDGECSYMLMRVTNEDNPPMNSFLQENTSAVKQLLLTWSKQDVQ